MFDILALGLGSPITAAISFIVLCFASWCVGEGGEILGEKYDASIIGGLIIAWLNTSPEAIFFITAMESGNPRFAVGAMSGSTIVVSTVALGAILYLGANARHGASFHLQPGVKFQCTILMASVIIPIYTTVFGFSYAIAGVGVFAYLAFLVYEITKTKHAPEHHHSHADHDVELNEKEESASSSDEGEEEPTWKGVAFLFLGGSLILLFAEPFIHSVVDLARTFHVNPILLAFFLAPIASEMPEILESISLSRNGKIQSINVAFSNLVGGTITKTTLLCGIFSYYGIKKGFAWESPNYSISLLLSSFCAFAAAFMGYRYQHQKAWMGNALFGLFVVAGIIQFLFNSTFSDAILDA